MGQIRKNKIIYSGGGSLDEMSDVSIDALTLANGQALVYNLTSGKWENEAIEEGVIDTITYGEGDTLATLFAQMNDYRSDKLLFRKLRITMDGKDGLILVCTRYTGSAMIWETSINDSNNKVDYVVAITSSAVAIRKFLFETTGMTVSRIETNTATSNLEILGLK